MLIISVCIKIAQGVKIEVIVIEKLSKIIDFIKCVGSQAICY